MTTLLVTHSACLEHEMPPGHPECVDRLRAVLGALEAEEFALLQRAEAPRATREQIARVHPESHIELIEGSVPETGFRRIDADTAMSPGSLEAAYRAAGAVVHAVDEVMAGSVRNGFCAVRPPGHHAEPQTAMGFCLFNNIAIGALHARAVHGCERVAVIDFDVHHGNGTQAAFETDPSCLYISTHQWPLYPGTGRASEHGLGNIYNRCLPPGAGSTAFRSAISDAVIPAIEQFRPDFIFISAGFDAHIRDPLANLCLTEEDYGWVTAELMQAADKLCSGRVVSALEGGYDLEALAASARAHVKALMLAA
ncbi:histone deacetylase family protein [Parvibaculum sp.]|jgi:acetoin utilization deacetylase AcuC-like enzyme|uniref:histone deacetylase family protein n=1 Tax=Parvibaculum sp. TaxID=2024848 RepID=UPI001B08B678|nr:histone deacetylase family protein [Parvibaculum sp.]MBO6633720.1 histone deacetylase family protein [Parvibaculum sp.]MBO6678500.1 histone deacetylase family protein [Parvibaculum sp.]MBO6905188.1 histone deacetylase family protein [Parvibaculum sp.]